MRKLTRMAAIGGVGLLALTACGDDETEENTESTEEEAGAEESEGFQADELINYAADNPTGSNHTVECDQDLNGETGSFVVCDITDSEGEEPYEYVMFTVNPSGDYMMRELYASETEPPSTPVEQEETEADGDGDDLPDFYNDEDSNSG